MRQVPVPVPSQNEAGFFTSMNPSTQVWPCAGVSPWCPSGKCWRGCRDGERGDKGASVAQGTVGPVAKLRPWRCPDDRFPRVSAPAARTDPT